jgi:hypothetical protein
MFAHNATLREEVVTEIGGERRSRRRYPIELPVQFKVLKHCMVIRTGTGKTVNVSSGGIAFRTDEVLQPRTYVELSMAWPVKLDDSCPLKLVASGRVVRSEDGCVAIHLEHYVFRTQGTAQAQPCVMAAGR